MPPEKLVIIDYCGTLSLEAPRFGRPENLLRALEQSGLAALGVSTPEAFWGNIVDPTWIEGSTTAIGYAGVMAERIASLRLVPDVPTDRIAAATSRFVAMYLAASRIDPRWRPILARLQEHPAVITVVATEHYAEATEKIIGYLGAWAIAAGKIRKDRVNPAAPPASGEPARRDELISGAGAGSKQQSTGVKAQHMSVARSDADFQNSPRLLVANSADLGVWKADRRFWEILGSKLPSASVRRILLIDDFGFNEAPGDSYGERAKVLARQEKTVANLGQTFQAVVEVFPFHLPEMSEADGEAGAKLIEKTSARIDAFLEGRS